MRAGDWATAVGVERIQVKTRWTKALGEARTVAYGDCKRNIALRDRTTARSQTIELQLLAGNRQPSTI